jgi:hypothetical protein
MDGKYMAVAKKLEISKFEKIKLTYIYFFPVVFLPFVTTYLIKTGEEPKTFFLTNVLISLTVVLIPLINAVCMFAAKYLHQDKNKNYELTSIGMGMLCFLFLMGCNYYQYFKFAVDTIEITNFNFAIATAILLSCFVSCVVFAFKYMSYSKQYALGYNQKIKYYMVAALFPLIIAISVHLIF